MIIRNLLNLHDLITLYNFLFFRNHLPLIHNLVNYMNSSKVNYYNLVIGSIVLLMNSSDYLMSFDNSMDFSHLNSDFYYNKNSLQLGYHKNLYYLHNLEYFELEFEKVKESVEQVIFVQKTKDVHHKLE